MTGWRVHAWVLMSNHYHLFLQTPELNLVAGMSWLAKHPYPPLQRAAPEVGRLFGDRYKAVVLEEEEDCCAL